MTEAQKTLYYIAENMKMDKSISEEGYEHFQIAIKALGQESVLDKIIAEIQKVADVEWNKQVGSVSQGLEDAIEIIERFKAESEDI